MVKEVQTARPAKRAVLAVTIAVLAAMCLMLGACAQQGPSKDAVKGVWKLAFSEGEDSNVMVHSVADMEAYRSNGMDITLELFDDDQATYSELGVDSVGEWKLEGGKFQLQFGDGRTMTGNFPDDNFLETEMDGVKFHFELDADDEDESSTAAAEAEAKMSMADDNGLSILMEEGQKLDEEVVVADDENVKLVIDGTGVAPTGDPGYNLQLENKTDQPMSVWVADPFKVGEKEVMVYMYVNLSPNESTTSFLQFDSDQLGSKSVDALADVTGVIEVDNVEGNILNTFEVDM